MEKSLKTILEGFRIYHLNTAERNELKKFNVDWDELYSNLEKGVPNALKAYKGHGSRIITKDELFWTVYSASLEDHKFEQRFVSGKDLINNTGWEVVYRENGESNIAVTGNERYKSVDIIKKATGLPVVKLEKKDTDEKEEKREEKDKEKNNHIC